MIASANRLRSAGWLLLLGVCFALVLVLAFHVNALRSRVLHAEERIVALKREKMYLETEFETRSNQQQLKIWNDVEFGYAAPNASQYLEGERELASLSVPATPDAPAPIRVASVDDAVIASAAFPAMVSPLSGRASAREDDAAHASPVVARRLDHQEAVETLGERLGKVVEPRITDPVRNATVSDKEPGRSGSVHKAGARAAEKPSKDTATSRRKEAETAR